MNTQASILIVDDEEVVRLSQLRILADVDCNASVAWNGVEALREMEKQRFDLVLLDLRMPGPDGMSVLKIIKERWPESEVVIITGYPSIETAKEAVRLGAFNYLSKPLSPDEVIEVANSAILNKKWSLQRDRTSPN